jgi:xylulokinase
MPGFPAPKLRWLRKHEPANLDRARRILLPKDVVRLTLSGESATDAGDGSATLLMDTRACTWDPEIVAAVGIAQDQLPQVFPSGAVTGTVRSTWATRWALKPGTPIVAGSGDNMCGALGADVARSSEACISLGTSGVYSLANERFLPALGTGLHTHRHAAPGLYLQNACVLSAGAALSWAAALVQRPVADVLQDLEAAAIPMTETPVFTPYLAGERTPHNDPMLTGAISGLTLSTTPLHVVQAVLVGVAMALGDCHRALIGTGASIASVALVGGGARSQFWATLIASEIGLPVRLLRNRAVGPALGAARLARIALGGRLTEVNAIEGEVSPVPSVADELARKRESFRSHLALRQAPGR